MKILILALLLAAPAVAQNAVWVDLQGDWRVSVEDRPEFASPEFDDRSWQIARAPFGEYSRTVGRRQWLRQRVTLPPGANRLTLALTLGTLQGVHQVFVNGRNIGDYGVSQDAQIARPRTLGIPAEAVPENGSLLIAIHAVFRKQIAPQLRLPDRGPYLVSAQAHAPLDAGRGALERHRLEHSPMLVIAVVHLGIALISILGWSADRRRRELLWFALYSAMQAAAQLSLLSILADPHAYPFRYWGVNISTFFDMVAVIALPEALLHTLGYRSPWLRVPLWLGWSIFPASLVFIGHKDNSYLGPSFLGCAVFCVGIVGWNSWRQDREGLLLRLALLLPALERVDYWIGQLLQQPALFPRAFLAGGHRWHPNDIFSLIVSAVILTLLLRRLVAERQERQRLSGELESARIVQQFLLSKPTAAIDAVYEPAQEVGGDFYQSFALADGSLLLAVGDVSGKGLKAAMVVSMLAGALRNRKSDEPAALLRELNAVVADGLDGGFVTAAIARCHADGSVVLANAGNPAPYVAGAEVSLDSGLPLGLDRDAEYPEHSLVLQPGERLTFVSDGVVEAENEQRELFGFERTREISGQSAHEIAEAARAWGQNDDITVVTVRRSTS